MKFLLLCFGFLMPGFLFPQQEILRVPWEKKTVVSFRPGEGDYEAGNAILTALATYQDKSPYHLHIGFRFRGEMEIRLHQMERPEITIRLLDIEPSDLPRYRGFSLAPVLVPSHFSCRLNLIGLPDSIVMRSYGLNRIELDLMHNGIVTHEIPVVEPGKWVVEPDSEEFLFDEQRVKQFRDYIALVNDYYAATALTDSLLYLTARYNPLSFQDLPEKYLLLLEINKIVGIIREKHFAEKLISPDQDPAGFMPEFRELERFSRSATMTFLDQLATQQAIPWAGETSTLTRHYVDRLMWYIGKSMLLNDIRGGIYREYLEQWTQIPAFADDEGVFETLTNAMYSEQSREKVTDAVISSLWHSYERKAEELITLYRHAEALDLLNHFDALHLDPASSDAITAQFMLRSRAAGGVFGSYLGIAENCIDQHKAGLARVYLGKALDYQRSNPTISGSDTLFQRIFRKLFSYDLQTCDDLLKNRNFREAIECYTVFEVGFPEDITRFLSDHLDEKRAEAWRKLFFISREEAMQWLNQHEEELALVAYERAQRAREQIQTDTVVTDAWNKLNTCMLPVLYRQMEAKGMQLYYQYKLEEAYQTFGTLRELANQLGLPPDSTIESMYHESHKYHILNEISMATGMIWNDQFDEAREYALSVESVMDLYNLDVDPDLRQALDGYRRKIAWKNCMNQLEEVRTLTSRASRNLEQKRFDVAVKQLGEARIRALHNGGCEIPYTAITDTLTRYLPAAFYQEKLEEIRHQAVLGHFSAVIHLLEDNERFYHHQLLASLGVPLTTLRDFVRQTRREDFTREAAIHFLQSGDPAAAWDCLCLLMTEGVEAKKAKELQISVGKAMASVDFNEHRETAPSTNLNNYTAGNHWFATFAKAYTSRWKELQML